MPVMPIPPPLAVTQNAVHHPPPQPQHLPQANVSAQNSSRAQTAKGLKQGTGAGNSGAAQDRTKTGESVDSDANALGARAQRRSGNHKLDVEI